MNNHKEEGGPAMQAINAEDLQDMMSSQNDNDILVINVLTPDSFHNTHISGSINVPLDDEDFTEEVEKIAGGKERMIVVHCASRECDASAKAARKLEDAGFTNIYDFEGGISEWLDSAGMVQRAA